MKRILMVLVIGLLAGCESSVIEAAKESSMDVDVSGVLDAIPEVVEEVIDVPITKEVSIAFDDQFGNFLGVVIHDSSEEFNLPSRLFEGWIVNSFSLKNELITFPRTLNEDTRITVELYSEHLIFENTPAGIIVAGISAPTSKVVIPATFQGKPVIAIKNEAFRAMIIDSVFIPYTIQVIGVRAFDSSTIQEVTFEDNSRLIRIEWDAFAYTSSLENIELPTGLRILGQGVFFYSAIKTVTLPATLHTISGYVFTHSMQLEKIEVAIENTTFMSIDGVLYQREKNTLLYWPAKNSITPLQIHEGTERISNYSFENSHRKVVKFPKSLTFIQPDAFFNSSIEMIHLQTIDHFNILNEGHINQASIKKIVVSDDLLNVAKQQLSWSNLSITSESVFLDSQSQTIDISLQTNGWVRDGNASLVPFQSWTQIQSGNKVGVFVYVNEETIVSLRLPINVNQPSEIKIVLNDQEYVETLSAGRNLLQLINLVMNSGHNEITIESITTTPRLLNWQMESLILKTQQAYTTISISPLNDRLMPASLTLFQRIPDNKDIEWIYSEVLVEENRDVLYTYYAANGFAEGYFGMQANQLDESKRWILFSVWSPFVTDDPNEIPSAYRVHVTDKGAGVVINDFGNEGSGRQSYLEYPWVTGINYGFLTRIRPIGENRTEYQSYFYDPTTDQWFFISTMVRPFTTTYAKGFYSFIEAYLPVNAATERAGIYNEYWLRTKEGEWMQVTSSNLIPNSHPQNASGNRRYDYDSIMTERGVELITGGFLIDNDYSSRLFVWPLSELPQHLNDLPTR